MNSLYIRNDTPQLTPSRHYQAYIDAYFENTEALPPDGELAQSILDTIPTKFRNKPRRISRIGDITSIFVFLIATAYIYTLEASDHSIIASMIAAIFPTGAVLLIFWALAWGNLHEHITLALWRRIAKTEGLMLDESRTPVPREEQLLTAHIIDNLRERSGERAGWVLTGDLSGHPVRAYVYIEEFGNGENLSISEYYIVSIRFLGHFPKVTLTTDPNFPLFHLKGEAFHYPSSHTILRAQQAYAQEGFELFNAAFHDLVVKSGFVGNLEFSGDTLYIQQLISDPRHTTSQIKEAKRVFTRSVNVHSVLQLARNIISEHGERLNRYTFTPIGATTHNAAE